MGAIPGMPCMTTAGLTNPIPGMVTAMPAQTAAAVAAAAAAQASGMNLPKVVPPALTIINMPTSVAGKVSSTSLQ